MKLKRLFLVSLILILLVSSGIIALKSYHSSSVSNTRLADPRFWYLYSKQFGNSSDTLSRSQVHQPDRKDSVLASGEFRMNGMYYGVQLLTNENHFHGVDGGVHAGYLDKLGIIYSHALTWRSVAVLHSDNDSLNQVIAMALGILARMEMTEGSEFHETSNKVSFLPENH